MGKEWVVVADAGRARVLQQEAPGEDLQPLDEWVDDRARGRDAAFQADASGRRGGAGGAPGGNATVSARAGDDVENQHAEQFARRVAERLAEARRSGRYDRLHLAAAPAFLGKLRHALPDEVGAALVDSVDKDLVHETPRELTQRFCPGARRPSA